MGIITASENRFEEDCHPNQTRAHNTVRTAEDLRIDESQEGLEGRIMRNFFLDQGLVNANRCCRLGQAPHGVRAVSIISFHCMGWNPKISPITRMSEPIDLYHRRLSRSVLQI